MTFSSRAGRRIAPLLLLACAAPHGALLAEVPDWPDYRLGDQALRDVYSPIRFQLLDPDATERRRNVEARKVPLVFRHNPDADLQSQAMLRASLRETRQAFLDAIEEAYERRVLHSGETGKPAFRTLLAQFRERHKGFPLARPLAVAWAEGQSDEPWLASWSGHLRQGMARRIRADQLPKGWQWSTPVIQLVSMAQGEPEPSLDEALAMATLLDRTNLVSLSRARQEFREGFGQSERGLGRFLSRFVTNNCHLVTRLSRQARSERREGIVVMDRYRVGAPVLRRGQYVDEKAWRALRELRLQLGRGDWTPMSLTPSGDAPTEPQETVAATGTPSDAVPSRRALGLRVAGLGLSAIGLGALWLGWQRRRRRGDAALPALRPAGRAPLALADCPVCHTSLLVSGDGHVTLSGSPGDSGWPGDPVRARVAAQILGWLKGRFVRALLGQRAAMHRQCADAEQDIQALARRLAKAQAPLRERLHTYETRIAELERELARKGEVNRELIKAQIQAARKQLEMEKGHPTSIWN